MRTVLVTGGAGFIGSHLVEALIDRGDRVLVIDNLSTGTLENLQSVIEHPQFRLVVDSIKNEPVVDALMEEADHVYHLAAAVGVRLIMDRPIETIETNVIGTEVVLRCANRHRRQILIASTSEIYGNHVDHALSEDDNRILGSVKKRRWAYACSKTLDEFLALAYFIEKQLPVVIARIFNTIGPRQTGQYGMVVPNFVQNALLGKPIQVYGTGQQTRSFTFVGDTVRALVALMDHEQAIGDVFNVGTGDEISILDLAHKIREKTQSTSSVEIVSYEQAYGSGFDDMQRRTPNITKIRELVSFEPQVNLDGIIDRVIEYFRR